jgi:hypothetical protein
MIAMNQIRQYQKLAEVKPRYYKLDIPYHKPSTKRIKFNLKETQLYYDAVTGAYMESEPARGTAKKGGQSEIYLVDWNL